MGLVDDRFPRKLDFLCHQPERVNRTGSDAGCCVYKVIHRCPSSPDLSGNRDPLPNPDLILPGPVLWFLVQAKYFEKTMRNFNGPGIQIDYRKVISDLEGSELISCFNVEKESLQPFPFPFPGEQHKRTLHNLGVLTDFSGESCEMVYALKVLENGDILMS
ncbi:F-box protein-like [Forsythia ovata]|uniref:F-box protein-like n=1 Tax=Forsythia ovata TaxID=205694 RepID=A0ABD1PW24_9LAMI